VSDLSEQQERFCRAIVKGLNQRDAYKEAGYKSGSDAATDANASRLISNDKIVARIAELRRPLAISMAVTLESITEMLREDRELARQNNQVGAAVAAAMGIAKLHGLVIDKAEVTDKTVYTVSNRPKTDEQWATEFTPAPRPN
jgi:phage terminase small subunit